INLPSATVQLRFWQDDTATRAECFSPAHVIDVVMGASENGLIVEGIYWTADDSVLISRAVIREFCAMNPDVARGWLSALWLPKLQEVRKDDRAIKIWMEDPKA